MNIKADADAAADADVAADADAGQRNAPASCVGLSPPRAKLARMVKKGPGGDEFGRALAKKGLGSDEAWPKNAPVVTITG